MRTLGALAFAVWLTACAHAPAKIAEDQTHAILLERTRTMPRDALTLSVDWFEPKAVLAPAAASETLPMSKGPASAPELAEAIHYSDARASTALLVWHDDALILERYGPGASATTLTQSQSMHKSIVSLLVGIARDEGAIRSLDDPVEQYIGSWTPQPFGAITIRHLLTMTSGLALTPPGEQGLESFANRLFNADDIETVARSAPQVKAPGQLFEYNNVNPQLLVAVLEAATGLPYEAYLSSRIWSKLAERPAYLWMDRRGGTPHGYCCMIATARDWTRIGRLLLGNGKVNGRSIVSAERVIEALDASARNPNYGQLIWRGTPYKAIRTYRPSAVFGVKHGEPYLAPDVFFLDGYGGQRVYVVPSRNLVIVRTGPVTDEWDDAVLPNAVLRSLNTALDRRTSTDCADCPSMIDVPAGVARLGSDEAEARRYNVPDIYAQRERPLLSVPLSRSFAIARTEITNRQFAQFVSETNYQIEKGCWRFVGNEWQFEQEADWRSPGILAGPDHPVTCVNAVDGDRYSAWLSRRSGKTYRLPSEAEWEYAARANGNGATYWNDSLLDLCLFANPGDRATERVYRWEQTKPIRQEYAWHGAACDDGFAATAPVANFGMNDFGLFDMIGNVNEWTADCFSESHRDHPAQQDPWRAPSCRFRLLKGHTWTGNERTSRPAFRLRLDETDRRFNLGFRVVQLN